MQLKTWFKFSQSLDVASGNFLSTYLWVQYFCLLAFHSFGSQSPMDEVILTSQRVPKYLELKLAVDLPP